MPVGPQGQRRPADAVARAVLVGRIATGEVVEEVGPVKRKGLAGAAARSRKLTPERKKEIAKAAAGARWR